MCGKARGRKQVLGAVNSAPLFPLLYDVAPMNKNSKQVLHVAGGTVAYG